MRSIKHIGEELRYLKKTYQLRGIKFTDELAITTKTRGYELADLFRKNRLNFGGQARVDIVDHELLRYLKKSGCSSIGAGIESGSQTILNQMNKKTTVQQNLDFITNCQKADLMPWVQFIFGYPGENDQTIKESIEFFKEARFAPPHPDFVGKFTMSSLATPLPGSRLYEECRQNGKIADEAEYVLRLKKGYYIDEPKDIILNLTNFSDQELIDKKNYMEETIWRNYSVLTGTRGPESVKAKGRF